MENDRPRREGPATTVSIMGQQGKRKRRHHTVPKMHLRRFADERDQLVRVVLPGDHRHPLSIGDASVENDFYMLEFEDGTLTDEFEDFCGTIETAAAEAVRDVVDAGVWPIRGETRTAVAMWAALQYLRTPAVRQQGDEIADTMFKLQIAAGGRRQLRHILEQQAGGPVSDAVVDECWRGLSDFDAYQVRTHTNQHMRTILDTLPGTTRVMVARGWTLLRFTRRGLMTSDKPGDPRTAT